MAVKAWAQDTVYKSTQIASVERWYAVTTANSAPAKPAAASPSGWSQSESVPDMATTSYMWFADKSVMTDGAFVWSAVSKSSSYEAAKSVYNAMVSQGVAQSEALAAAQRTLESGISEAKGAAQEAKAAADGEKAAREAIIYKAADGVHVTDGKGRSAAIYGPESIEFLNANLETMGRYSGNKVELGSSSDSAVISMRNGTTEIFTEDREDSWGNVEPWSLLENYVKHFGINTYVDSAGLSELHMTTSQNDRSGDIAQTVLLSSYRESATDSTKFSMATLKVDAVGGTGVGEANRTYSKITASADSITLEGSNYSVTSPANFRSAIGISPKVLWSGVLYMQEGQTATLSEKVSNQPSGIVLVWSAYKDGKAQDYDFTYGFVPKTHVQYFNGKGIYFDMIVGMSKYVYVNDTKITGNKVNNQSGTRASGFKYTNTGFVLRQVIGV